MRRNKRLCNNNTIQTRMRRNCFLFIRTDTNIELKKKFKRIFFFILIHFWAFKRNRSFIVFTFQCLFVSKYISNCILLRLMTCVHIIDSFRHETHLEGNACFNPICNATLCVLIARDVGFMEMCQLL